MRCRWRKRSFLGIAASVCALVLFSGCRHHSTPEKKAEFITGMVTKELKLNDSQQSRLQKIKEQVLAEMKTEKEFRREATDRVLEQLASARIDQDKIKSLLKDRQSRMQAKADKWLPLIAEFVESLEPEQREKLVSRLKELKERFDN